jgi:hypothetical protein
MSRLPSNREKVRVSNYFTLSGTPATEEGKPLENRIAFDAVNKSIPRAIKQKDRRQRERKRGRKEKTKSSLKGHLLK